MMNLKNIYGGSDATSYFVRETVKSTWFTQCPVTLSISNGIQILVRSGLYSFACWRLLGTWLNVTTPLVELDFHN